MNQANLFLAGFGEGESLGANLVRRIFYNVVDRRSAQTRKERGLVNRDVSRLKKLFLGGSRAVVDGISVSNIRS